MSNPLKKTMVFLGLAEEDLEEQQAETTRKVANGADVTTSVPKSTEATASSRPSTPARASVTPLRRVTPAKQTNGQVMNEILTVRPASYSDAMPIAENFREGVPVIINLSAMHEDEAMRLIDFASGLAMGLHGSIERVTSKVFLLTPEHIEVESDSARQSEGDSFFVSPNA